MVRTRIAPSPTGQDIHVGTIATALVNFAWAKKHKGQFIVRIEDTDRTRLVEGAEHKMLDTLKKIGLTPDESPEDKGEYGPYRQSDRLSYYKKYAQELIEKGDAYYCICTPERLSQMRKDQQAKKQIPKYDRLCLGNRVEVEKKVKEGVPHVIRLRVPENQEVVVNDLIRGEVKFNTRDIDDQVLLKSDGFPTYHLAVVVDDHLMKITHVIRAEEWLPSTPKHILLYQMLGWDLPQFAHLSLLRNPDKSKLSKRKNPVWASYYLEQGIFSETLLNYLALMAWSHPKGAELFSLEEYVEAFDLKDMQKTAPVFDPIKLDWMNGEYIRKMGDEQLKTKILDFYRSYKQKELPEELVGKTVPIIKERIKKLSEYLPLTEFFFDSPQTYEIELKGKGESFKSLPEKLDSVSDWKADKIGEAMMEVAKESGIKTGEFFMNIRVAITGKKISPPLNESMEILGKSESLKRINILCQ